MPYKSASEQQKYQVERRRKLAVKAKALLGAVCLLCGYTKSQRALDFHHLDPATKSFGIGDQLGKKAWKDITAEIAKCVLLCSNCHREVEDGLTIISQT